MSVSSLQAEQLRIVARQNGFTVKALAMHSRLGLRTFERRFGYEFRTTPKAWLMRERMTLALEFLGERFSNKEIAASLNYSRESNFCRDFKRYFGYPPQQFARTQKLSSWSVAF